MSRFATVLGPAAFLFSLGALAAEPGPKELHVRGDVASYKSTTLDVKSRDGRTITLELTDQTRIALAEPADLSSIAQGTYVGTTARPQADGTLRAVEVHVFPESMRGAGEGHRPWDLEPGSSMTNATVSAVASKRAGAQSSMTNATVAKAATSGGGLTLDLKYPSGEQTVLVPPGTPVVKLAPGSASQLTPGAHVFAAYAPQPDGKSTALRIVVGANGVRPPM